MPQKQQLKVVFALNMCTADPGQMPNLNGLIVVPIRPDGSWYGVCSNTAIASKLAATLSGSPETELGEYPVMEFSAGNEHTKAQLQASLEKAGYAVTFVNEPPWL